MSNKDKILATAQKNLQKGQIPKAIKDFRKLVEIDPKDMRTKQKLADLYSRAKMTKEAFEQYEGVARFYADNGFYLKAIAVYKQMQKLDPSRVEIYHRLAELNQKQGLVGNALAEYRSLAGYYEKNRMYPEALNTLQKMKEIDPQNLNLRVKIAETYARAELKDKGLQEFNEILQLLRGKQDRARELKLYEIFLPMFPAVPEIRIGMARTLIERGEARKGIGQLKALQKQVPENPDLIAALAYGFTRVGEHESARLAYRHLLQIDPEYLDYREGFLRSSLAAGKTTETFEKLEQWKDAFYAAERIGLIKEVFEQLRAALPEEPRILTALQNVYHLTGDGDKLLDVMTSGKEGAGSDQVTASEDEELLEDSIFAEAEADVADSEDVERHGPVEDLSEDAIEELPEDFLEEVGEAETELTVPVEEDELDLELELELESVDEPLDLFEEDAHQEAAPESADEQTPRESDDFELVELTAEEEDAGEDEPFRTVDAPGDDPLPELEFDLAEDEETAEHSDNNPSEQDGPESSAATAVASSDLEEIDFFIQQGLFDEARQLADRLRENHPSDPELAARMGELESLQADTGEKSPTRAEGSAEKKSAVLTEVERARLDGEFSRFKKGLEAQIDESDAETHFNLGIAYKEMGLLNDAVSEFDNAMGNPTRLLDALILKGICLREMETFEAAQEAFTSGLLLPDISGEEQCSLNYEVGLLFEQWQKTDEARQAFEKVSAFDPFFRDVAEKLKVFRGTERPQEDEPSGPNKDRVSYI